jgi:GNAT superfamily N-acetyltransferase
MYQVRRMMPIEFPKLRAHLKALDADSKSLRFGYHVSDEVIDALCDGFKKKQPQHTFFIIENANLEFVAVGHVSTEYDMELAFSVLKDHQGQGMGDTLMKRCIQYCRVIGKLKGCMVCLNSNAAIRHLCRKNGIKLTTEMGETLADIELDHPDLSTYINEGVDTNLGAWEYLKKCFARPLALLN